MTGLLRAFRDFFVSLKLTVVLLALSIVLIFWATLSQADLGVWGVQQKFFHSFFILEVIPGTAVPVPVFPGGYFIGGLLLANLLFAHFARFKLSARKAGIWLTHAGLILLLVGELLSGLWQQDYQMVLHEGETRNYSESFRDNELAIADVTDPKTDTVTAIPEAVLARGDPVQTPRLPFRVVTRLYYPNAELAQPGSIPNLPPSMATQGPPFVRQLVPVPRPVTYRDDERNEPAAYVELVGPDGSLGTWLVSTAMVFKPGDPPVPQHFEYGGRSWKITLRVARRYVPYSVTLLKVTNDIFPGTDIPKNFASRVRLKSDDGRDDREVVIYMNNPLRYRGLTYYQYQMSKASGLSVLQVVSNPSWRVPYAACAIVALGLTLQFGMSLVGFVRRRRTSREAPTPGGGGAPARRDPGALFPVLLLVACAGWVAFTLMPPRNPGAFDLAGFGRLPVLADGRVKPIDTLARSSLLQMQGRQDVVVDEAPGGPATAARKVLSPLEWLLDVSFRPERADGYKTFAIDNPDLLSVFGLKREDGADKRRFSFDQMSGKLDELERQAKLADPVDPNARTSFQRAVLQLYGNVSLYEQLKSTFADPGSRDFLGDLLDFQKSLKAGVEAVRAKEAGKPHDEAAAQAMIERGRRYAALADATHIFAVPPETDAADANAWMTTGQALVETFGTGTVDPAALVFAGLSHAWRGDSPETFNHLVGLYRKDIASHLGSRLFKCDVEARFNAAQPFYTSTVLYVLAFLLAVVSWLKWPETLGRAAFWLVALSWAIATAGIATRMWLEGRPPVTNLYSSALFIGWGAVGLCLILEATYRNAIGSVAAGLIGFGTLVIAHNLSLSGDTMEMMRAVLDSNFWLSTHVVVVTTGYASTYLAGFLALIYIVRGTFTTTLDKATADALARMVYGIVCFATLFSFVGTVLGGIWADQSWGRFWGWDPKENGALIIVVWNALILHARWGGMVRQRGLMCLAVFGNIVTSWSWFGTNMLGVGLHSYGFTEAAFQSLVIFIASQLAVIAVANRPLEKWRSFGGSPR
jgi:ABC-type transport system involved in cytochrome c biogenesis permease subunit